MLGHRKLNAADYLTMLRRRRWLILTPVILLPMIAYGITFLIPAEYLSQTLVLIEEQKVDNKIVEPIVTTSLDSRLASMREQILSRSRLEPIIAQHNLYPSSRFTMDDRVDLARKAVAIKPIRSEVANRGGLPGFFVTFTASDARTAQLVCADITSLFISASLKLNEDSAQGTTDFLKGQLDDAKRSLDEQDKKLAEFQTKYSGKLPGQETPNLSMMNSLNSQLDASTQALTRMQQDRSYQESMLTQLQAAEAAPPAASGGGIAAAPQVDQTELQTLIAQEADLSAHYTSSYPDVIAIRRKIADLKKKMALTPPPGPSASATNPTVAPRNTESQSVQQLRAQIHSSEIGIQAKQKEQAELQASIANYRERIESSPAVEEQYKALTRDYDTAKSFYDELLGKMNQAQMATSLEHQQQGAQFTLMDAANLPDSPTFPKRWVFALGGLFAGLAFGLVLTALLEYRDTALRTEQDVWAFTKLPTLAVIAYAGEIEPQTPKLGKLVRLKRLFGRKAPDEALSKAHG
jgi:polysaccharide chain length determinant protein (PEP-CTERM system associated)